MTTTTCPGCHGAGTEMSGTTHAGLAEHLACDECGPDCPQDCGCRVDDAAEHHEFVALCHPGATQSPDGSPRAAEGLRGAESAVSDAEAAEWAALADAATEGPWHVQGPSVEEDDWAVYGPTRYVRHGSAAWARGEGHPRLCSALYAATVAREVLAAALDSPPGAATLVELATEAARRLTGIADLDAERAVHMQRWAEQAEPMLGIRGHERECADRAGRRRELSRPFLAEGGK